MKYLGFPTTFLFCYNSAGRDSNLRSEISLEAGTLTTRPPDLLKQHHLATVEEHPNQGFGAGMFWGGSVSGNFEEHNFGIF